MRLRIETAPRSKVICTNTGERIMLGERYQLLGHPGHSFRVSESRGRNNDPDSYLIELFEQGNCTQIARVHKVSAVAGIDPDIGTPIPAPYLLDLVPGTPIFPTEGIIQELLKLGVESPKIHLLFGTDACLTETRSASKELPHILTDGDHTEGPSNSLTCLSNGWNYKVEQATWAIMHTGSTVDGVYLWVPANDEQDAVLAMVDKVRSGALN